MCVCGAKWFCCDASSSVIVECHFRVPDVQDQDKPVICTFLVYELLNYKPTNSDTIAPYLKFLLVVTPGIPKSGLATHLPCSTMNVSICTLLPDLTEPLLNALLRYGTAVKHRDIDQAIEKLKNTQYPLLQLMIDRYLKHNKAPLEMGSLCEAALHLDKTSFVTLLVSYGAKPNLNY